MADTVDEEAAAVILAIVVVAGVFAVSQLLISERVVEPFSALGVLGSKGKIGDYPRTVLVNDTFRLYLYVDNHEGRLMYYTVYVKLGDRDTRVSNTTPADAPIIAEYQLILPHGYNRTIPIDLSIPKPMVDARLIFELWTVDPETPTPTYHGRWCQLWLNVTAPSK